ncbi:MAG: AAC(3) family N-acetyltransferase [Oscillospiraceae bacterium]|nr:AAC(3) family N-acetyltransferase [Oscillospiraceae bacterium]
MLTQQDVKNAVKALGLSHQEIALHTSLRSFDEKLENGPETLYHAFLDEGCTLLVPTFSYDYLETPPAAYRPAQNACDYTRYPPDGGPHTTDIFTPDSKLVTTSDMGAFSAYLLRQPGSVRGRHPINSFTAAGPYARQLTAQQSVVDVYAPFRQLCADGGYLLLVGVGLTRATIIHYAEQLAGRSLFVFWAKDEAGAVKPILGGGCSEGFENLAAAVRRLETKAVVGGSLWRCFPAAPFVEACASAVKACPSITHCADPACPRCRDALKGGPVIDFEFL